MLHPRYSVPLWLLPCALLLREAAPNAQGDTNTLNQLTFSTREALNVTGKFRNVGNLFQRGTRTTPNGDLYNYDDGYVLTDSSGNFGGQTWYWGYDESSQVSGNTMLMNRSTLSSASAGSSAMLDSDSRASNVGGEIAFTRHLGRYRELSFGLEAAASYLNVALDTHTAFAADVSTTTDAYPFAPGTTPPQTPPAYQGTFNGPGFVIGSSPSSSSVSSTPGGATISGRRAFDADVWGLRLGPHFQIPFFEGGRSLKIFFSGGLAMGAVNGSSSFVETATLNDGTMITAFGKTHGTKLLYGGFASAGLTLELSDQWNAQLGMIYEDLGRYEQTVAGRSVELNLSQSFFMTIGVGFKF